MLTRQAVIDPITTAIAPITLKPSSGAPVDAPREPGVTAPAGIEGPRRDPGIGECLLIGGARGQCGDQAGTYCCPEGFAGALAGPLRLDGVRSGAFRAGAAGAPPRGGAVAGARAARATVRRGGHREDLVMAPGRWR